MAIINCAECGKEVSDQAKACPSCGISINQSVLSKFLDTAFGKGSKLFWIRVIIISVIALPIAFVCYALYGFSETLSKPNLSGDPCQDNYGAYETSKLHINRTFNLSGVALVPKFPKFSSDDVKIEYMGSCNHRVIAYFDLGIDSLEVKNNYIMVLAQDLEKNVWRILDYDVE